MRGRHGSYAAWTGTFEIGDGWAAYVGPVGDSHAHAHAAVQLVFPDLASGEPPYGIRPLVTHRLDVSASCQLVWLPPWSKAGRTMSRMADADDCLALPPDAGFPPPGGVASWVTALGESAGEARPDERLTVVMAALDDGSTVAEAAKTCDLSPQRLRALARQQLGIPLTSYVAWRRLECAAGAMSERASIAEAAARAGFADQAHLTRTMRRTFGVTPGMALAALR
jgi:AraC-like DNA-binding protein